MKAVLCPQSPRPVPLGRARVRCPRCGADLSSSTHTAVDWTHPHSAEWLTCDPLRSPHASIQHRARLFVEHPVSAYEIARLALVADPFGAPTRSALSLREAAIEALYEHGSSILEIDDERYREAVQNRDAPLDDDDTPSYEDALQACLRTLLGPADRS